MFGAWGSEAKIARDEPFEPHAPNTTALTQFVATYRTRATLISPWHALRAPTLSRTTRWPGTGFAISAQSRGARFPLDAGEMAPRSCTCAQAIGRRYHLTERTEHATEISGLPGFGRRRRSGRERWRMAHGAQTARLAHLRLRATKRRVSPMRHTPPFSPRSSPPTEPGQPGYLRGMLCALREMVTPPDGLGAGARSRRNLACI